MTRGEREPKGNYQKTFPNGGQSHHARSIRRREWTGINTKEKELGLAGLSLGLALGAQRGLRRDTMVRFEKEKREKNTQKKRQKK